MKKMTPATEKQLAIDADIGLLTGEVEAHRLVLAWLLKQQPDDAGSKFLSSQANALENKNKEKYAIMIDEFDLLRGLVSSLHESNEPPQQPLP